MEQYKKVFIAHVLIASLGVAVAMAVFNYMDNPISNRVFNQFDKKTGTPIPDKHPVTLSSAPMSLSTHVSNEIECLTEAVYFEARGEALKRTVPDVIFNRVDASRFPDTVCAVVFQPYQFSFTMNKQRKVYDVKSWNTAKSIASRMYMDYVDGGLAGDATFGALFYYNPTKVKSTPTWVGYEYHTVTYGNHVFFNNDRKA